MKLAFQEFVGQEARYRGVSSTQTLLVREVALDQREALEQLRREHACLTRTHHEILPELAQAFEEEGCAYLVTVFPKGLRMDQKAALKNLSEDNFLEWVGQLNALIEALASQQVHLEIPSDGLIRTRDGKLKLIDLRGATTPENLERSRKSLLQCVASWLPEKGPKVQVALERLSRGESPFEADLVVAKPQEQGRIPLAQDPRRTCLAPGSRLANYEVEFLTLGGMSLCYLGTFASERRFIKEVHCDDSDGVRSLRREFEMMRKLKHPNIVRAHQIFEQSGYLYLVMDYLEGSSLAEYASRGPVNEDLLLEWAQQLCDTLTYLHSQNPPLIYRDLKPANVVRLPEGQLYLIDFGLLRSYKAGQSKDTQALGTFSTASPEHFTGQTDARSDLFSLGATLYLLASPGFKPKMPFKFPPLRSLQPQYSVDLEALIQRCLQSKPADRWPSAQALATEVAKLRKPYIKEAAPPEPKAEDAIFIPNLSSHLADQARQLRDRVAQGKPLQDSLNRVAETCEVASLSSLWRELASHVEAGQTLASGLKRYPKVFSAAYVSLIEGNEKAHLLDGLQLGAELLEKDDRARRTRATPSSEPSPLQDQGRGQRLSRRVQGGILLLLLGLALGATAQAFTDSLQNAVIVGVSFWIGSVTLWAAVDARLIRVIRKTQNLVEDAWTSFALGETEKAEKELAEALVLSRDKLGPSHLNTLASLHSLANLCRERRQFEQAHEYYKQALSIYEHIVPHNHLARAHLHQHWARCFEAQKNLTAALEQIEKSQAIVATMSEEHPLELADVLYFKGRLHFEQNQDSLALDSLSQSLEIQYTHLGLKSPLVHSTMSYLTRVYVRQRLFKESEGHLAVLLSEAENDLCPNHLALAEANVDMGLIRLEQNRKGEAEPYFLRALQFLQHFVGPNQRLLDRILEGYCRVLEDQPTPGVVQLISTFSREREALRQALEKAPELIHGRDNTGWGPIQWAIFIGRNDIVRWLLSRGADPGYDSSVAMGPLHVACAWDRAESLYALLERDPDVNASGPGGWTPVFWCSLNGHVRLLENLIKRGANVNHLDELGRTPLHIAAANDRLKAVAALIGAGARVNAREPRGGATALHHAAERGYLAVCDCLIYNKADLSLKDAAGQTPLDLASNNSHKLLSRAMRKHLREGLGKSGTFRQ